MAKKDKSRERFVDVIGPAEPWDVDRNWVTKVRNQLKEWADDEDMLKAGPFRDFIDDTPPPVWYLHSIAPQLGGYLPVMAGEYADISAVLTQDFYRPTYQIGGNGFVRRLAQTDWPLLLISGTRNYPEKRRKLAIELSKQVVDLFLDAPPFAERARTLSTVLERVLYERETTELHTQSSYGDIVKLWRSELLHEPEREILPELAGPSAALASGVERLDRVHHALAQDVKDRSQPYPDVLANILLAAGHDSLHEQVVRSLGEHAGRTEDALDRRRENFNVHEWLALNAQWLAQAIELDQVTHARTWVAAASALHMQISGMLKGTRWPVPEVPDIGQFTAALQRKREGRGIGLVMVDGEVQRREEEFEIPDYSNDPLGELESLIGLESIKDAVKRLVAETKADMQRRQMGLKTNERARHMVFVGKPGTAKTTIARLLGRIYQDLGVLEKGHVIEVDRSDLVGAGVGTTAPMTAAKFREALGGVFFVDEAYSLVPEENPGDFGLEAVSTILKMMEDHRDEVIVIVAGYHREMQRFLESNTGLTSRFPKILAFSDYNDDQLVDIFELIAKQRGFKLADGVLEKARDVIPRPPRSHTFGNGRFMRNVFEETISNQATRLAERDSDEEPTKEELRTLLPEDVTAPTSMRAEDYLMEEMRRKL